MRAGNPPAMDVLVDHFAVSVGADGSILVPKDWRPFFGGDQPGRVALARRPGPSIGLHPWRDIRKLRRFADGKMPDAATRKFQAELGAPCETVLSSKSRLRLPDDLRRWAGIKTKAMLVGCFDHAEIMSMKNWKQIERTSSDSLALAVRELGI